jgi:hypothetical protein
VLESKFRHLNYIRNLPPHIIDEPPGLLGDDTAPNPSEAVLAALGSCISVGIQPGFNPGNRRPERFALKGRQIERTNNAAVESNRSNVSIANANFWRSNRCELYQVSLSPLQGELVYLRDPRVETLG